eukprot:TRINITY_DN3657_c0_g1_i1.p2 TRINITY_DN3657_c0_g1~~TRINITY_DN3657_c0_g1_i1.p2  ORF type:complete len:243 (+),score=-22.46 TRINITY_DN3657_c0_g1_i1:240-968(+)
MINSSKQYLVNIVSWQLVCFLILNEIYQNRGMEIQEFIIIQQYSCFLKKRSRKQYYTFIIQEVMSSFPKLTQNQQKQMLCQFCSSYFTFFITFIFNFELCVTYQSQQISVSFNVENLRWSGVILNVLIIIQYRVLLFFLFFQGNLQYWDSVLHLLLFLFLLQFNEQESISLDTCKQRNKTQTIFAYSCLTLTISKCNKNGSLQIFVFFKNTSNILQQFEETSNIIQTVLLKLVGFTNIFVFI